MIPADFNRLLAEYRDLLVNIDKPSNPNQLIKLKRDALIKAYREVYNIAYPECNYNPLKFNDKGANI